jgi:hypothetical protein
LTPADVIRGNRWIFIAISLFVVSAVSPWLADRVFQHSDTPNVWTLDMPWTYAPSTVAHVVTTWQQYGRNMATVLHLTVDVALPVAYALALIDLISRIPQPGPRATAVKLALMVPVGAAAADLAENALIVWIVNRESSSLSLAAVLWTISWAKWCLLLSAGALGLLGVGKSILRLSYGPG